MKWLKHWEHLPSTAFKEMEKLLELTNKFSKTAGYKINTQNSVAFLYISNETSEWETEKIIWFVIVLKIIKYLGIHVAKEVKDLCTKNYKILIEKDTNKWKDFLCCGLEELILLKSPYYPKESTDLLQSLSTFRWHFSQK